MASIEKNTLIRDCDVATPAYFMTNRLNNRLRIVLSPIVQHLSDVASYLCVGGARCYYISGCVFHITQDQMRPRKNASLLEFSYRDQKILLKTEQDQMSYSNNSQQHHDTRTSSSSVCYHGLIHLDGSSKSRALPAP